MKHACKQITKEKHIIIGKRIRDEMKARKLSRKDMIKILYPNGEIKSENTISQMCGGIDRHFTPEHIRLLANEWEISEEYLLCETSHKTQYDKCISEGNTHEMKEALLIQLLLQSGHTIEYKDANLNFYPFSLGSNSENIIINGLTMSRIDFYHMSEDILNYINFIVGNASNYVDRRQLHLAIELSKELNTPN